MRHVISTVTALAITVVAALTIGVAAQDLNPLEKTYLTFSAPVELPGMTLPAGTYTFKLADTQGRNVVQVLSQDEQDVLGQFLFVQATRTQVSGETVVTFRETAEGRTPAVQYWYYPGESIGKEFIYPKDQAERIAARTGTSVLSDDGRVTAEATVAAAEPAPAPEPQPAPAPVAAAPEPEPAPQVSAAPQPAPERETVGTAGQQQPAPTASAVQEPADELPRTASPLPLAGLMGLLSLAGAAGLRLFRG